MQAAAENDDYGWLVGIDWATDVHEVCILTPARELVTQRKVDHNGQTMTGRGHEPAHEPEESAAPSLSPGTAPLVTVGGRAVAVDPARARSDACCRSRLTPKQIEKVLSEHRIRRLNAEAVRAALAEDPLHVAPGATEAVVAHIRTLLPRLRVTVQQRATCQREMARLLDELAAGDDASAQKNEHRDVQILRSLVGVGKKVATALLAEASQPPR